MLPGLAHWIAGRRRAAVMIATAAVALLVTVVVLALTTSRTRLLQLAVQPGWLTVIIAGVLALALAWVVLQRALDFVCAATFAQDGMVIDENDAEGAAHADPYILRAFAAESYGLIGST